MPMINVLDNKIDYKDVCNDKFGENLKNLSIDQVIALDIKELQNFAKQKEEEYKKDYEEMMKYRDVRVREPYNNENSIRLKNKCLEIQKKYSVYIVDFPNAYDQYPKDFKNCWILSFDRMDKQYEYIRKIEHTQEDLQKLHHNDVSRIFSPDGFGWIYHLGPSARQGEGWKAMNLPEILQWIKGDIDRMIDMDKIRRMSNSGVIASNLKMMCIRIFVNLKYLLVAAQKYNDRENVAMIEDAIEYVIDKIKNLDDIRKKSLEGVSQEILDTIK